MRSLLSKSLIQEYKVLQNNLHTYQKGVLFGMKYIWNDMNY